MAQLARDLGLDCRFGVMYEFIERPVGGGGFGIKWFCRIGQRLLNYGSHCCCFGTVFISIIILQISMAVIRRLVGITGSALWWRAEDRGGFILFNIFVLFLVVIFWLGSIRPYSFELGLGLFAVPWLWRHSRGRFDQYLICSLSIC